MQSVKLYKVKVQIWLVRGLSVKHAKWSISSFNQFVSLRRWSVQEMLAQLKRVFKFWKWYNFQLPSIVVCITRVKWWVGVWLHTLSTAIVLTHNQSHRRRHQWRRRASPKVRRRRAPKQEGSKMFLHCDIRPQWGSMHYHLNNSTTCSKPGGQVSLANIIWYETFVFVAKVRKDTEINWLWKCKVRCVQWLGRHFPFNCSSSSLLPPPPSSGRVSGWRTSTPPPSCSPSTATHSAATHSTRRRIWTPGLHEWDSCLGSSKPSSRRSRTTFRVPSSMMRTRSLFTTNTHMTRINLRILGNTGMERTFLLIINDDVWQ